MKSPEGQRIELQNGVFTLSLDFELIWGTLDLFGPERFRKACTIEREVIIDRLLDLLVEFEVPATWCILGHLFLDRCESNGTKHREIHRPSHAWHRQDWFRHDPGGDERGAPLFLGRSLIEKIRACRVTQEIGSHSFSHVIFGDAGCSRETASSEITACVRIAREMGISLKSFAFPRNSVGHLEVLRDHGFSCYRGPEPSWYVRNPAPFLLRRLAHLFEVALASEPPVILPRLTDSGLWDIPGSMIYFPMHGIRRFLPVSQRVKRARKGLEAAIRRKKVFHLWFHPTNLADRTDAMFGGLRQIFEHVNLLRDRGELEVLPMGSLAPEEAWRSEAESNLLNQCVINS